MFYFLSSINGIISTGKRSGIRGNMNSARGIDAKHIVTLLKGFQEKIDHDPFSESTYEISRTVAHTLSNKKIKSFSVEMLATIRKARKFIAQNNLYK